MGYYQLELTKTAYLIAKEFCRIKPGESVLITGDTENDWRAVEAVASAAQTLEAKVAVLWHAALPGFGKVGDPLIPDPVKAAIANTDVWVEFNNQWLLYSTPWDKVMEESRVRHLCLVGMDTQRLVRMIGKIDLLVLNNFQNKVAEMIKKAEKITVTSPGGTDISFENDEKRPFLIGNGIADKPGVTFPPGNMTWSPVEDSMNGTIVFDGSMALGGPLSLGILRNPIKTEIKKGKIVRVTGGKEAKIFEKWLADFNNPNMYNIAHTEFSCNPGAVLSGLGIEDERLWGAFECGIGDQSMVYGGKAGSAPSHADSESLDTSWWLDSVQIQNEGKITHPDLFEMARKLGR